MSNEHPTPRKPLRLWPGVLFVTLQWLAMFVVPMFAPQYNGTGLLVGISAGLVVLLWWLFFSRAAWSERLGVLAVIVVAVAVTKRLVHPSVANGMMGFMVFVYAVPVMSLAVVAGAVASRGLPSGRRRASLAAAILLACGAMMLVRTNGVSGDAMSDFEWRWTPTAEERLLARSEPEPTPPPVSPIAAAPEKRDADAPTIAIVDPKGPVLVEGPAVREPGLTRVEWVGFRGTGRDSTIRGVRIDTDWSRTPPVELWRRPIGPAWSSFAVSGDRLFTQEQRGEDEMVSAYDVKTGNPVWKHRDAARFWESNAGAGPRGTPTLHNGRVYTLGGTGILNALDARDGSVVWSRNAVADTGAKIPDWGIASSPVVVNDIVVAATAGRLAAYDVATGKPRWFGPKNGWGYSSPHLMTIDGVAQLVLINGPGAIGVSPSDGTVLWKHEWPGDGIVQPALIAGGDVLIGSGSGLNANTGMLRINVAQAEGAWVVKERWATTALKPYFNDFVVHAGHAFGFDGSILACIDLADGTRKWKGGRYGHGQLVLLPEQNLLLVLSEDGELALVSATPDKFTELARVPGIEGKTWNHPVLVNDVLLVRNGEEMAAFRLSLAR
jgi:outer membrane protein assembly factor BamB